MHLKFFSTSDVILGGTHQVDNQNLQPDPADKMMIINGCQQLSPPLKVMFVSIPKKLYYHNLKTTLWKF